MVSSVRRAGRCLSLALPVFLGCAGAGDTVRMSDPVALESGVPENACEEQAWLELVPTLSFSEAADIDRFPGFRKETTLSTLAGGYGVFRTGSSRPEKLDGLLRRMNEPSLREKHMQRIRGILRRKTWTKRLMEYSIVSTAVALVGMTSAPEDETVLTAGAALSITGLVAVLWGSILKPSAQQKTFATIRETTFLPGEDDMEAVQRGVTHLNEQARARCGGKQ